MFQEGGAERTNQNCQSQIKPYFFFFKLKYTIIFIIWLLKIYLHLIVKLIQIHVGKFLDLVTYFYILLDDESSD